jgi:serine/threonine protein kinase
MEEPALGAATQKLAVVRGTRLGPYEVIDLVGAGGMGEVYRARDTRLGRDVAIKVLPEEVAHDPDALARFGREARAAAALSHPHIAALFDFGLARLQRKADASGETASTTGLGDGVLAGTLPYMAPEQVRGQGADARSDIFALGAVLYEMLSGRRAFAGETTADLMTAILMKDPDDLSRPGLQVPASLERIVRRCLEKDPEQRFQSARDVAFAVETESAPSRSRMEPAPAPARPRRCWLAATAIGLPLLFAAAGIGLLYGRRLWERPLPKITQLTFRRGLVDRARFTPDGKTIVYSAFWTATRPRSSRRAWRGPSRAPSACRPRGS